MDNAGVEQIAFDDVVAIVNRNESFTKEEIEASLVKMSDENKIMYSDGIAYLI